MRACYEATHYAHVPFLASSVRCEKFDAVQTCMSPSTVRIVIAALICKRLKLRNSFLLNRRLATSMLESRKNKWHFRVIHLSAGP